MAYVNKRQLYERVDKMVSTFNCVGDYPINSIEIAKTKCNNPKIKVVDLGTPVLCAGLKKYLDKTIIVLNKQRTANMQNFDCMHELIHYFFHKGDSFQCTSTNSVAQNSFLEWQANEGAAQALVPYQLFIPDYIDACRKYFDAHCHLDNIVNQILASKYGVTTDVVIVRRKALTYEIYQYMNGVPIENISLLSASEIEKRGLSKQCIHEKSYCMKCKSVVPSMSDYCPICGNKLVLNAYEQTCWQGDGYMIYPGIKINKNGVVSKCPNCNNEEIDDNALYCKICGVDLKNRCIGDKGWEGEYTGGCNELADPNARYCIHCGGKTSFYANGYLNAWDEPEDDDAPF